jgi:predicted ATPase
MVASLLKKIRIQNFKAWEDTKDINLWNITLLYWTNSSWKTSIIQFLLLLKQTIDSTDALRVLQAWSNNWLVDLWTNIDFFNNHDLEKIISFNLKSDEVDFFCEIMSKKSWKSWFSDLAVKQFLYTYSDKKLQKISAWLEHKTDNHYNLIWNNDFKRKKWKPHPIPSPYKFYRFPQETFNYYKNAWNLFSLSFWLENIFNKLIYIWPLRQFPNRIYEWSWEKPSQVWSKWEYVVNAILSAENEWIKLNRGKGKHYKWFMDFIAWWLSELWLVSEFKINKIWDSKVHKMQVKISANSPWVDIADVWFWVSQILPILVQAYYADRWSIIIVEQPEIHLHPMVQSVLADLFINASKERGIQFIIESHSEHLLRRMQLRIAQQQIDSSFVKTYFCKSEWGKSILENLETDTFGNIINWPENFFWDEAKEMEDFLLAQIKARKWEEK